jgi:hypothetical protein
MSEGQIETRIWDFIDGLATATEQMAVAKLIKENKEWKDKYTELLEVHGFIQSSEMEHPSLRFTKNIMERISAVQIAPATKKYINHKIIWSIAVFFIFLIGGFIIYGVAQTDWSAGTSESNLGKGLSNIDYSKIFNNNFVTLFMMGNVLLGLMLLDRILSNKKKKLQEIQ